MKSSAKNLCSVCAFVFGLAFLLSSCGSGRDSLSPREQQQFDELVQRVEAREFEIVNEWAHPQKGSNVSLIGNSNFIRFEGDSVNLFLPYFGERYSGGGYGTGGGIEYKGPLINLMMEQRQNKQDLLLSFEARQDGEQLKFLITFFPNGNTSTSVTTSERSSISYRGKMRDLPAER